jgi:predicted RNA polymerase sigma factor
MLQTVLGFGTAEIARAFAMPAPTMLQRLVRAKRRIRDAGIPFAVPDQSVMAPRLTPVLEAVYGAYAIDWQGIAAATERTSLSAEALYLAETLAELTENEPEVLGLAALLCLSLARAPARVGARGEFVPLSQQPSELWDVALIERGETYLVRAHRLGRIGRFQLEAAIQSAHCARRNGEPADWSALRKLHQALLDLAPTLGAAVALAAVIGETDGPAGGRPGGLRQSDLTHHRRAQSRLPRAAARRAPSSAALVPLFAHRDLAADDSGRRIRTRRAPQDPATRCMIPGLSVYVDHLFAFGDWGRWSGGGHLQADTLDELHEFAARLGLRREWFQSKPGRPEKDHYDLTRVGRELALELGAIAEDRTAGARRRQAIRHARRA